MGKPNFAWSPPISRGGPIQRGSRLTVAALIWAALITASTLTTKQHYAIDVLAGLVVAAAAGGLARAHHMIPTLSSAERGAV